MTNRRDSSEPPVVLIHGLWLTPRSWEHWVPRYEAAGYRVLTPTYPGFEGEVDGLRADPSPIANLTIDMVADHYEAIVRDLDTPPILIGHSFGGTVIQLLLDRGLGAVGVAIDSALVKGIRRVPISQIRALFPALDNPAHRHEAVGLTPEQFHYAFTNCLSKEESQKVYDRYHIPAPGRIIWAGALANFQRKSEAAVDFKRPGRAPLLFIAGSEDHVNPASVNKANYKLYLKSDAVTEYTEFAGRCHFTCGQEGWEPLADYALAWATYQLARAPTGAPVKAA
jgi:pimeloyl-ACP methyl ester carboxylesterase